MTKIKIENLKKVFQSSEEEIVAVDDLDIDIKDGEFLVFVGPSGCGKTTSLRCLSGLEEITEGSIYFDDRDVTNLSGRERNVAMVFQNYALYPHMNVRKNIGFGLKLTTKLTSNEIRNKVEDVANMLGIEDLLGDKPKELSGGQQQRVALGRAIVRNPEVFLLDEPLSNLDAKLRTNMRTEILELQQQLNITTVYVTHDQTEAMAMGDRIAVMKDGELQQIGEPEELYIDPNSEFVASFLGSPGMNIFSVEVKQSADSGKQLSGPGEFLYNLDNTNLLENQDQVRVGLRPEDIRIVDSGGISANVNVVEHMGNENYMYMRMSDVELSARVDRIIRPNENETIQFTFDLSDLYLFDSDSGESIKTKKKDVNHQPEKKMG